MPLAIGPMMSPAPATPAQTPIAWPARGGPEHVGEDRQGGRHDQGAAQSHDGAGGDEHVGRAGVGGGDGGAAEDGKPDVQTQLAPEAVTEAAAW